MLLFGGMAGSIYAVTSWDESTRAKRGDFSGHSGKMRLPAKLGLGLILGCGILVFVALVDKDRSTFSGSDDFGTDDWECSGSMKC
ncbi:MAG: hypothetical protein HEQ21_09360 [Blastomonas sp.]|uniref:hypothetical protein n=1 Tax=Blastomonas sp. TaxID=1909299 RepID=UPI00259026EC|nr:hypothetical protein [Blastomonas sp.]MCO5793017.1 hypothetical protein [Blastomonas sp.]